MEHDHLTYQWLVPQLIGVIGGLVLLFLGVIGWIIRSYLSSIKNEMTEMNSDIKRSNEQMMKYFDDNNKKHHETDIRITKIEEHLPMP